MQIKLFVMCNCNISDRLNKQYALRRRQAAAQGSKNRSRRKRLCAFFSHPHSSPPKTFGFLYKVGWNVAYLERYVPYFKYVLIKL